MTITDHVEIITKWIASCDRPEQLKLCKEVIEQFIVERFKETESSLVILGATNVLSETIKEKELSIVSMSVDA